MSDFHPLTPILIDNNPPPEGGTIQWIQIKDDLHCRYFKAPAWTGHDQAAKSARATLFICPGRTEFIEKYFELACELQAQGFATLIIDWLGQGLSSRQSKWPLLGHIGSFDQFVETIEAIYDTERDQLCAPIGLLCHSMGGAIGLATLIRGHIPIKVAAFCAPMWGIRGVSPVLKPLSAFISAIGLSRTTMQKGLKQRTKEIFEDNSVTHDQTRWQRHEDLLNACPDLALGPVSWGWLNQAFKAMSRFTPSVVEGLNIPILLVSAEEEKLVDNATHDALAPHFSDMEHVSIKGAMHEILMETNSCRAKFHAKFQALMKRAGI